MISKDRLLEVISYDPETGLFSWAVDRKKCSKGSSAGSSRPDGYSLIRIDYKRYYAHRLAWLYMTGEWPSLGVDHADGDPSNNRWSNLRLASPAQNMQNRQTQKNNSLGVKGVRKNASGYYAMIQVNRVSKYLGTFRTVEQAAEAYATAAKQYFGEFARLA